MPWGEGRELVKLRERKIRHLGRGLACPGQFRAWNSTLKVRMHSFKCEIVFFPDSNKTQFKLESFRYFKI